MKRKIILAALALGIGFALWGIRYPLQSASASDSLSGGARPLSSTLSPGVYFQQFHLTTGGRPVDFFVVRMARDEASLTLDTVIADGSLTAGRESVAQMAARADGALNAWGGAPGGRNRVLAAVNGYYFDLQSGRPWRGVVQSNWYAQRFDEVESGSGFVWTLDGRAFVGGCVHHQPGRQSVAFEDTGAVLRFQDINVPRPDDALVLYTWHFGARTGTNADGLEVLVELDAPLGIAPAGSDERVGGVIRATSNHQGNSALPYGYVVLSAHGKAHRQLLEAAKIGERVSFHQEVTHLESDCSTPNADDWGGAYAAIGGDYVLLRDGQVQDITRPEALQRNARTAVAYNDAFVFLVVADGWNPGVSEGVTIRQLGLFLRDVLGATDGITLDSGGSATMWVDSRVVNNTYCNFTHHCGPDGEPGADGVYPRLNPLVGTALAVIAVQPKERSLTFVRGEQITTRRLSALFQGPGWNFARLDVLPAGDSGVILPTQMHLGGLRAENAYWWRVRFGAQEGWIPEHFLEGGVLPARDVDGQSGATARWLDMR
ncbi:MAG: hypothetical protein Fur0018_04450 [Anaerolineales bacterium]